jgi:hypothetical protein
MGWLNRSESASRILTRMLHAHATITGFRPWRDASMRIGWGFGGREGARTPDLLVANDKLAVQDVHKVLSVQQNAFSGHKLLRAFSLADWTLERTPRSFCDSQNRASANRDDERPNSVGGEWHAANPGYASRAERTAC